MFTEEPEIFYKLYPYNHWLHKANMLKNRIDTDATAHDDVGILAYGSDPERYKKMLKYELHFTYFQQIEALFEILFALQTLDDKHIWFHLSDANGRKNYGKIKKIANGELDLDEQEVELSNGETLSFLEWALYAGYSHNSEEDLENTIKKTKRLLKLAAQDFSDRAAYNAYKHGMRVLPLFGNKRGFPNNKFDIVDTETAQKLDKIDFSNSFTYLDVKSREELSEVTITYSPEQDLSRIQFISLLMFNIIKTRRVKFYNEETIQSVSFSKLDPSDAIRSKHDIKKVVITHEVNGKENHQE